MEHRHSSFYTVAVTYNEQNIGDKQDNRRFLIPMLNKSPFSN